jgi:hypothetical protein
MLTKLLSRYSDVYGLCGRYSKLPVWLWSASDLLYNGYWRLFPWGLKQKEREADHSQSI